MRHGWSFHGYGPDFLTVPFPKDPRPDISPLSNSRPLIPKGFSFLNGVRELSDGTVLAADPLGQLLLRIDLATSSSDTLGQVGPGPQEYEQPDRVFPLPGDSTLLVDFGKMQLTSVGPDGRFGSGLPMALPGGERFPVILDPKFVDDLGRLYDQAARSRDGGPPDSAAVIRYDRGNTTLDTVASVWLPEYRQTRSRSGGYVPRMLQAPDAWAVGPDGRVAVVRANGFSVEWHLPDGVVRSGPANDFPTHPVRREDKEAVLAGMRNSGISMTSVLPAGTAASPA